MSIGASNRRITIQTWGSTKKPAGGTTRAVTSSYTIWAQVEDRHGRQMGIEGGQLWSYDYKITMRYEKSRPVISTQTILYDSKELAINDLSFQGEGNRKMVIARCSAITK
jgi:SPP1 family predicted phage head-tail adaptor